MSKSRWAKPPHRNTKIAKYTDHINEIVNLANVNTIYACRERYYPDNEGIPVIVFTFKKGSHQWYFDKGEEDFRDQIIEEITEGK